MSYSTHVQGGIYVSPALNYREILLYEEAVKQHPEIRRPDLKLKREERSELTDAGLSKVITSPGLEPGNEDDQRAYNLEEEVILFARIFGKTHTFVGELDCTGAENGDVWTMSIVDGKAVRKEAKLVWDIEGLYEQLRAAQRVIRLLLPQHTAHALVEGEYDSECTRCVGERFLAEPERGRIDDRERYY